MFKFKKSLGQNFLTNKSIVERIVSQIDSSDDALLEIGPGGGALTEYLSAKKLYLVEKDDRLIENLEKKFPEATIFNEDFLKWDFSNIGKCKVIGAIPYNITGAIVRKLIDNKNLVSEAVLVVQKEVAERAIAKPGDKNRGLFSLMVQLYSEAKMSFVIGRRNFVPVPKVDSAVLHLKFNNRDEDPFLHKVVKAMFANRRKQLLNNLTPFGEKRELVEKIKGLDLTRRAETLNIEEIERVVEALR